MNPRSTDCKADALTTTPSNQYADNLVLISESVENLKEKFLNRKQGAKSKPQENQSNGERSER